MTPLSKNDKDFRRGDRVFKLFGHRRTKYWATVLTVADHSITVLWDNGEIETLEEWDCRELEVVE